MSFSSVRLMGGLGNCMFQIAAAYGLSIRDDKEFICDFGDNTSIHNPYSIYKNNFFRKIKFSNNDTDFKASVEIGFEYKPIPYIDGNIKIIGYYQSEKYFSHCKDKIFDLFEPPEEIIKKLKNKFSNETCSIHIRRGDYVHNQNYHTLLNMEYYKTAIDIIGTDKHFLIFSDDMDWCQANFNFLNKKTFVKNDNDYEDLYLMSMCNHNIIANSSFSWWGAWLNKNVDKKVISPVKWFGPKNSHFNTCDLYCENWIKI